MNKRRGRPRKRQVSIQEEEPRRPSPPPRKQPRRVAASCSSFREEWEEEHEEVAVNGGHPEEEKSVDENAALALTVVGDEHPPLFRRLFDFVLNDADGALLPFEMAGVIEVFMTGRVVPASGDDLKGVLCRRLGKIESWDVSGYESGQLSISVWTEMAKYECYKPARGYKKFFDAFSEKVRAAAEVYRVLLKSQKRAGGLGVDELVAGVVRSMSGCFTDGIAGSNFVFSIGDFIYRELQQFDGLASMPALLALRDECRSRMEFRNPSLGSALRIGEEKRSKEEGEAVGGDEKLARLLQEEEDRKLMRKQRGRRRETPRSKLYIKISEAEMAEDYPLPAFYKPLVHEMDEYLFLPEECELDYDPVEQEARVLNNWSVYNSDSRMVSLELLPMKPCAENDVPVFGSGSMTEGEAYAYGVETEPGQSSYSCSPSVHSSEGVEGIPIYLSAIKEWMIEYGASMIFVLIRTDVAWYRLGRPSKQYTPWHEAVVRIARLAVSIIKMLKEESRVSRLSFVDVIKKISEFGRAHPSHISSAVAEVERYVVVHGQIILQIFTVYPDKTINKCAFVTGLSEKMEERRHTKLVMNKKKVAVQRETNLNPNAEAEPVASKRKVMRATMTRLINRIWGDYYSNYFPEDAKEGNDCEVKEGQVEPEDEHEQEETDEEDAVEENAPAEESALQQSSSSMANKKSLDSVELRWEGESICGKGTDEALYRCAMVNGERIRVGGAVMVYIDESSHVPALVFVEYMFESKNGLKMLHGRVLSKGSETLLGNAANEREVFLTHDCIEIELGNVKKLVVVDVRSIPWGHEYRKEQAESAVIDREKAAERRKKGLDVEFYCKSLYWPEKGAFFSLPLHTIGLGSGVCSSCRLRDKQKEDFQMNSGENIFTYNNTEYRVGDFVYIKPQFFSEPKEIGKFKAGRNVGLKPYTVCHLLEIQVLRKCKKITPDSVHAKIRRFYRPEDVSAAKAYCSDIREVYYSEEILSVPLEMIEGKCEVWRRKDLPNLDSPVLVDHIFFCEHSYDAGKGSVNQLPSNVKSMFETTKPADSHLRDRKGKGKCKEGEDDENFSQNGGVRDNRLATLDIFAGCGGLSEGLQRSGVSHTKWAIEYEQPAGEAFSSNHPMAEVFVDNCNVILRAIMQKGGDLNDCIATPEATELASKLEYEKINNLPMPGQVDFINGGPPCQGFSGMNRFNHGTWSKVQCEMILAFLSFADYFRPRFFLLENVRNFVSYNKGQTFQLTVASLLEMGYQVRFGVLEAGAFGVSQSRKRAFIWAASPQETLPEWPEPMHVFAGPELKISLPRGVQYSASRSTASGAPFRSITVRDTIGDLPPVGNGASRLTIDYESDPVSWFQKQIRGKNMMALNDHISKEMNELNFIRCQRIPKQPGADWRNLPDEKVKLSNGQMVDLIPWCLPNTAKRHNQWKGLFGRLDWEGNFPTSITDPQPMGKVGMCFHPHQDRILTVRECARSQGFSDSYIFCGSIQNKHRQIGNAVPPPLAYALGMKLKEAVGNNAKH